MEIKSAAQWKQVNERISWKFDESQAQTPSEDKARKLDYFFELSMYFLTIRFHTIRYFLCVRKHFWVAVIKEVFTAQKFSTQKCSLKTTNFSGQDEI